jgi:hypothetical protein
MKKKIEEKTYSYGSSEVLIVKESSGEFFFEVGNEITTDISEAVAIMINKISKNSEVWNLENNFNKNIHPEKSIYWLSGGHKEWRSSEHYKKSWREYSPLLVEEYGNLVKRIIKKSKTLGEIRDNFLKYMNLSIIYEFALDKEMIK